MMKFFAILDIKSNFFLKPFVESSSIQALRGFEVAANEAGSTFNRFPDDFALCELGEFDPQTGRSTMLGSPLHLGTARSLIRVQPLQSSLFPPRDGSSAPGSTKVAQ